MVKFADDYDTENWRLLRLLWLPKTEDRYGCQRLKMTVLTENVYKTTMLVEDAYFLLKIEDDYACWRSWYLKMEGYNYRRLKLKKTTGNDVDDSDGGWLTLPKDDPL